MSHKLAPELESCIAECTRCAKTCLQTAMNHCLDVGGRHVEPPHFRLMVNCADICTTAANFMIANSSHHHVICGACAEICEACAASCADIGDMEECVDACRQCAESCRTMAAAGPRKSPAGASTGARAGH